MTNNKPISTITDGSLKATTWKNQGDDRPRYSVKFTRVYTDQQGNFQDADTFTGSELLRIARLAQIAYDDILQFRKQDKADQAK